MRADVAHTSLQTRAIRTVELALDALGRSWFPVRRDWRLNERHYGDLTGRNKAETAARYGRRAGSSSGGAATTSRRRRSAPRTSTTPTTTSATRRSRPEQLPLTECLDDVVARMLPYWFDAIVPDLRAGHTVLVGAHGNSLRALVKHLDDISDDDIVELNIPTGEPLRLRARRRPRAGRPMCRSRSATCAARRRSEPQPRLSPGKQNADETGGRWNNGPRQGPRRRCGARSAEGGRCGGDGRGERGCSSRADAAPTER